MSEDAVKNEITVTPFDKKDVRVIWRDEAPWFCAKDICTILQIKQSQEVGRKLDADEFTTVVLTHSGRPVKNIFVSEPGLYHLILSARKNELVAPFRRWVTHDVLPSIRKTGAYAMPGTGAARYDGMLKNAASIEFGQLKFRIAQMIYNEGLTGDELHAAIDGALMELAKGIALNYDAARWNTPAPDATVKRLDANFSQFGQFQRPSRMELIQTKGGFYA
ncbi:MAG: Bro-N domain-containing protein [Victivallales bacterium]|nr:Bro-N domain-containing protein [Victivallales bacterium]